MGNKQLTKPTRKMADISYDPNPNNAFLRDAAGAPLYKYDAEGTLRNTQTGGQFAFTTQHDYDQLAEEVLAYCAGRLDGQLERREVGGIPVWVSKGGIGGEGPDEAAEGGDHTWRGTYRALLLKRQIRRTAGMECVLFL